MNKINEVSVYIYQTLYFRAEADSPQNECWVLRPFIYTNASFLILNKYSSVYIILYSFLKRVPKTT